MKKIEHLGVAVQDIKASDALFKKLLGKSSYKHEVVESEGVITSFYQIGESKIELVGSNSDENAIARYLAKNREGIHHIAFDVENIHEEIARLKTEGFEFINETPKKGADNKWVVFIHPKSANGILVELCQDIK